ncbi:Pet127 protein [Maudiozyma humilis]|uniref:Pet127 protein n=1 Tax=Maudiozyma humilis TaxID=51915 RepID=A0AAV5RYQ6_MAUHU|nr:Pet127 protein [Kazachstania humilis]
MYLAKVRTGVLRACRMSRLHSTGIRRTRARPAGFNTGIKVDLANGTVVEIPPLVLPEDLAAGDKGLETEEPLGRVKGRKRAARPRSPEDFKPAKGSGYFEYNSEQFNKECRELILPEELEKRSFSHWLTIRDTHQKTVLPNSGSDTSKPTSEKPPQLSGELHRVLYEPLTLHQLRDPRSGVYLFDPKLEMITPSFLEKKTFPKDKDGDAAAADDDSAVFTTPYKDKALMAVATESKRKYISSSSSMTSILSQMHFLFSNFRPLNINETPISSKFPHQNCTFSRGARFPATVIMRKMNKHCRSIDSDRSFDKEIVLSILGHALEEFLTVQPPQGSAAKEKGDDFYHYSKIGKFIVRSQLDAYDPKLPGTGVFDLKTRAVSAIRHDLAYVENNNNSTGYQIDKVHGQYESLEKEFFELTRATLLKYSLQSRIGKMDGIFVAYHNISKMFGFQYLPQEELDFIIHSDQHPRFKEILKKRNRDIIDSVGKTDYIVNHLHQQREIATRVADSEFRASFILLQNILAYIESEINNKMKAQEWDKCKIMMQTTTDTVKLSNGEVFDYPILQVIAFPLPLDYKDQYVVSPSTPREKIEKAVAAYETKIENEANNKSFTKKMIGFEIRLSHSQHTGNAVNNYVKREPPSDDQGSSAGDDQGSSAGDVLESPLTTDYYSKSPTFQTPNFLRPEDVDSWKMNAVYTPLKNPSDLSKLYLKYCGVKINALRNQSVVQEDEASTTMDTAKGSNPIKQEKKPESSKVNDLKVTLRAYGLKGSKTTSTIDNSQPKKMWRD